MNEFLQSISLALGKTDGRTFWPGSGGQLTASYIAIDTLDIFTKLSKLKSKKSSEFLFKTPTKIRYLLFGNYLVGLKVLIRDGKIEREVAQDSVKQLFSYLNGMVDSDPFCLNGTNLVRGEKNLQKTLEEVVFRKADSKAKKDISRLVVSLDSMIWALYYDVFIDAGMEYEGPYRLEDGSVLLIKDYFDLKPLGIWSTTKEFPFKEVKLFLKYKSIDLKIDCLLHETSSQSLSPNLLEYSVQVSNGKSKKTVGYEEIDKLIYEAMEVVSTQTALVDKLKTIEKIYKGAEICYYQLKEFREAMGSAWKPPKEVFEQIDKRGLEVWEKFDWKNRQKSGPVDWSKVYDLRESAVH